jgi:hypothetical protein
MLLGFGLFAVAQDAMAKWIISSTKSNYDLFGLLSTSLLLGFRDFECWE